MLMDRHPHFYLLPKVIFINTVVCFCCSLKIDHHNIQKPITNGSVKRWQTKENIFSPFTPTSVFLSSGKCRKMCFFIYLYAVIFPCCLLRLFTISCVTGKHCKIGGDRFIPVRNSNQMAVTSFLFTKNQPFHANKTLSSVSHSSRSLLYKYYSIIEIHHFHFYRKNKKSGP